MIESYPLEIFAKRFFPDRFSVDFSPLHDQMIQLIDSPSKRVCIAAPRGIGKTSLVALALSARAILYDEAHYILYVSNSETVAEEQTENLKAALLESEFISKIFGDPRIGKAESYGLDERFSKKAWVAFGRTLVIPRGSGQQVRGRLFRNQRPDLIIIDDLEDDETIGSEDVRRKRKTWFMGSLLNCVSNTNPSWRFVYIDTLKHEDALLASLLDLPGWDSLTLSICDDNYRSLAPSFMSDEIIQNEVEMHREAGTLDVFYRERRNMPISTEDASFSAQHFRYYDEMEEDFRQRLMKKKIENIILMDIAKTTKPQSAWSAIIGVGVDVEDGRIYVRDIVAGRLHPEQIYAESLDMGIRLNARVIGMEVTGLNEFLTYPFKTEMSRRGLNFEIIELKARRGTGEYSGEGKGKEARVATLAPFYRKGQIFHNKLVCGGLEAQLLGFPRSKRWDIMDAFAYIVEILDMGLRYFMPGEEVDASKEEVDAEFDGMYEDMEKIDWQTI